MEAKVVKTTSQELIASCIAALQQLQAYEPEELNHNMLRFISVALWDMVDDDTE